MTGEEGERGHAAHRIADHAGQALDAEGAHDVQRGVGAVLDGQLGEIEPVEVAGPRIDRGRTGGALAAAQRIDADDEPAVAVDRLARAEHRFPPAFGGIAGIGGGVRVGREAGEDQYGVVARGVERAPGFVGDARIVQGAAAFHRECRGEGSELRAGRDELGHADSLAGCRCPRVPRGCPL